MVRFQPISSPADFAGRDALATWDREIESRLAEISLLGELELSYEETSELGGLFCKLFAGIGVSQSIDITEKDFPHAFSAFLVFQGMYGYTDGDFWSSICSALDLSCVSMHTIQIGQAFERILDRLALRQEFGGQRYVGAILGQGGIPSSSLPDFFENLLHPAVRDPAFDTLSTSDLIGDWLTGASRRSVSRPAQRFLQHGGRTAEELVEGMRRMVRDYRATGALPVVGETDIAPSILSAYHEWLSTPIASGVRRSPGAGLRRPYLYFDPWGAGVCLYLPEEPVPASRSRDDIYWRFGIDDDWEQIRVRVRRIDQDLQSQAASPPIMRPVASIHVRLYFGDDMWREWRLEGVAPDSPMLVFDPSNGKLLSEFERLLPATTVWLLHGPGMAVEMGADTGAMLREQFPRLPWHWHEWHAFELDLAQAEELRCGTPPDLRAIRVAGTKTGADPELVGAEYYDLQTAAVPLYVGAAPRLRVPLRSGRSPRSEVSKWRIRLHHEQEAEPQVGISTRLTDLDEALSWESQAVELALNHPSLLGSEPIGQYRLNIRGPLGYAADLRFRVVPRFFATGHEGLHYPDPANGAFPVRFLVEIDRESRLEPLHSDAACSIKKLQQDDESSLFQVEVSANEIEAPLLLLYDLQDGRTVHMPLRIPVQRLRWLLMLHPEEWSESRWQSLPILVDLADLDESEHPYLLVDAAGAGEPGLGLRVIDDQQRVVRELDQPVDARMARFYRFDLRLLREALRQSLAPIMHIELVVQSGASNEQLLLPALVVRRSLHIDELTAQLTPTGENVQLEVQWQPDIHLRGRVIHLWPLTYPWRKVVSFVLPDEARHGARLHAPAEDLPAGRYLVEFGIRDPWLPEVSVQRPVERAPNVRAVLLGDVQERLGELQHLIDHHVQADFELYCQWLFLNDLSGNMAEVEQGLQWCFEHVTHARAEHLMALSEHFQTHPTAKAIKLRLYLPERVQRILTRHERDEIEPQVLALYFEQLPDVALRSVAISEALLQAPDDKIRLAAAQQLTAAGRVTGPEAILAWLEHGQVSVQAAVDLLAVNLPLAVKVLEQGPGSSPVDSLWETLATVYPDQVPIPYIRVGHWVRCKAGWARVTAIESATGESLTKARSGGPAEQKIVLKALLRPEEDDLPLEIHVAAGTVHSPGTTKLFLCTLCYECAAPRYDSMGPWHMRARHVGDQFSFREVPLPLQQSKPLVFASSRPSNLWD